MSQYHQVDIPDYVEAFYRGTGYGRRRLLAITYQFDAGAFESRFESLFRRSNQQIDVVVGVEVKKRRESYGLWRARWPGTFHPKLIVLLGDERVAAGIGSSNMTWGGLGNNLECWQFFDDMSRDRDVLAGVRNLLLILHNRRLVSHRVGLDEIAFAMPESPQPSVLCTLDGTLIDQVLARIPSNITALDIVSPLNCDPRKVVERLAKRTGAKKVQLYTGIKTMPVVEGCSAYWSLTPPPRVDDEEECHTIYACMHAKMFAFHSSRLVHLFWGSANLSQSAWLRSDARVNVDLLVHSQLSPKQWAQFLSGLPCRHYWKLTTPISSATFPEDERLESDHWQLLQAVWNGQRLVLEASDSTTKRLWFRGVSRGILEMTLRFAEAEAAIERDDVERLGFRQARNPDFIEYRDSPKGAWRRVLVNGSGHRGPGLETVDAMTELFWMYTGRLLPGKQLVAEAVSVADDPQAGSLDGEEEELTRCLYQGELDQLVLQWRLVVSRVVASARDNAALRRHRLEDARQMVREEADSARSKWTPSRLAFVERLLDEALEVT